MFLTFRISKCLELFFAWHECLDKQLFHTVECLLPRVLGVYSLVISSHCVRSSGSGQYRSIKILQESKLERKKWNCHCLQMTWYFTSKILKILLELINVFGKVAGYKINIQKSVAFLYTNNELAERDFKETITFTISSKE